MKKKISESEWEIMNIVWKLGKTNLSQILEQLDNKEWSNSTIQTYLARLVKKEYIKIERKGHTNWYMSNVSERDCKIDESKKFLDKVFEGSLSQMILQFSHEENLSKKEKESILKIIERWEDGYL